MPFRPLSEEERAKVEEGIKVHEKRIELERCNVAGLKQQLEEGEWYLDPEELRESWVRIRADVARQRAEKEAREVTIYGRALTENERVGWTSRPPEIMTEGGTQDANT